MSPRHVTARYKSSFYYYYYYYYYYLHVASTYHRALPPSSPAFSMPRGELVAETM